MNFRINNGLTGKAIVVDDQRFYQLDITVVEAVKNCVLFFIRNKYAYEFRVEFVGGEEKTSFTTTCFFKMFFAK